MRFSNWLILSLLAVTLAASASDSTRYQRWLEEMREQPRGPFSRIRWFCNDGTVLPPQAYACRPHGGGVQHGQWSERTIELRANGYLVGNLLAGIDPQQALAEPDFENHYAQRLIEKFLMGVDNGWIFRQALFYRGAIQEEDERAGARRLLSAMLDSDDWSGPHYLATRVGVQLLPHGADTGSTGRVREQSAALSRDDPAFMPLRIKIHGAPDAGDAAAVRAYIGDVADPDLQRRYRELADEIDAIYRAEPLPQWLRDFAASNDLPQALRADLAQAADGWDSASALMRMQLSGSAMAALRDALPAAASGARRLQLLDASLRLETAHFQAATRVRESLAQLERREVVAALAAAGDAAYGAGLFNARLHSAQSQTLQSMSLPTLPVVRYRAALNYLGLAPGWAAQALRRYFYQPMLTLAEVEPLALLFIQDRLRGSPMLFYSQALNLLARDAGQLAGVRHRVFGREMGSGFTPLNPGLARGRLYTEDVLQAPDSLRRDGIYLLPETVSELPPVAGILTLGAGNPLSHVQLLARNLGIPNVSVDEQVQQDLRRHHGEDIVLAVSPGGLVEISADAPRWDPVFGDALRSQVRIRPDLQKLDLDLRRPVSMDELSAADSGRTVGPKAARLAQLRKYYPDAVARGVALPFGAFRAEVLDRPHRSGSSLFEWMRGEYRRLESIGDEHERMAQTEAFRREVYDSVRYTTLSEAFVTALRQTLAREFPGGIPGLFVRSDTNVEDLAGFTGAGLNLTLPNVVGIEQLLEAIPRVWASPFTARAFSWRQSHMTSPEHVYTSILLLESVGSDKSGVLVTSDIDTGDRDTLSVAVNEGLGGAVDGQAAESLRIPLRGGAVRVMATATAPQRRVLNPAGGIARMPSSGSDRVLSEDEIARLRAFALDLAQRFPPITDDAGQPAPADVEFGFLDGRLRLFQLRPFLDSAEAQGNSYLQGMDRQEHQNTEYTVDMGERPGAQNRS